ncbi:MAG: hypothetical protein QOJ63_3731, partial [Solirubrobacteraceae bacterium]|nr:hypothetical protein [Solirubrobacteraceae bacterium]
FSLFDASYFPSLSLEYLTYELLGTDEHLAQRYPSNTMPVLLRHHSTGFDARSVVALFPENHIDGLQLGDDLIFYFIDKFVERHYRVTRKLLAAAMARECLPHVRSASVAEVQAASAWWVRLHEYHHRQGDMPIPEFLAVKRRKALAGLEELRVDVSGMLACLGDRSLPAREARLTYEFILAERLLRYAVEGIPRPNYDAVASQVLFNYLTEHGALAVRAGRIHLSAGVDDVLAQFLGEIEAIERRIHEEPKEDVQQRLLAFANAYADVDHAAGDYRHIPYFQDIKERLRV